MRRSAWTLIGTAVLACALWRSPAAAVQPLAPGTLRRVATVDARFQSYNVEMAEVTGGNFWKPYGSAAPAAAPSGGQGAQPAGMDASMFQARPPIDLGNARLRLLAAALGPAYVRTSGTWANMVYFHDADTPPPPAPKGFQGVLTRAQWKGVIDFARAVDATLVSSFTISTGVRDASGVWTADQARRFVAYTKAAGGQIAAAEFFNEPDLPGFGGAPAGYKAADFARDFAIFRAFAREAAPDMRIVGPGSVGEGVLMQSPQDSRMAASLVSTPDLFAANPRPEF